MSIERNLPENWAAYWRNPGAHVLVQTSDGKIAAMAKEALGGGAAAGAGHDVRALRPEAVERLLTDLKVPPEQIGRLMRGESGEGVPSALAGGKREGMPRNIDAYLANPDAYRLYRDDERVVIRPATGAGGEPLSPEEARAFLTGIGVIEGIEKFLERPGEYLLCRSTLNGHIVAVRFADIEKQEWVPLSREALAGFLRQIIPTEVLGRLPTQRRPVEAKPDAERLFKEIDSGRAASKQEVVKGVFDRLSDDLLGRVGRQVRREGDARPLSVEEALERDLTSLMNSPNPETHEKILSRLKTLSAKSREIIFLKAFEPNTIHYFPLYVKIWWQLSKKEQTDFVKKHPSEALALFAALGDEARVRELTEQLDREAIGGALYAAAAAGHSDIVRFFLTLGIGTETEQIDRYWAGRALREAAQDGHLEVVRLLLALGVGTGAGQIDGDSASAALFAAAAAGHPDVVKLLLTLGIRVINLLDDPLRVVGEIDQTIAGNALIAAAAAGHHDVVELLLATGIGTGGGFLGLTIAGDALLSAATAGHLPIVERLLALGVGSEDEQLDRRAVKRALASASNEAVKTALRAALK